MLFSSRRPVPLQFGGVLPTRRHFRFQVGPAPRASCGMRGCSAQRDQRRRWSSNSSTRQSRSNRSVTKRACYRVLYKAPPLMHGAPSCGRYEADPLAWRHHWRRPRRNKALQNFGESAYGCRAAIKRPTSGSLRANVSNDAYQLVVTRIGSVCMRWRCSVHMLFRDVGAAACSVNACRRRASEVRDLPKTLLSSSPRHASQLPVVAIGPRV